jgi:hypothetical protein
MIPRKAMKYLSLLLLSLSMLCTSLYAVEYGYLKSEETLILNEGDLFEVLNFEILGVDSAYNGFLNVCSFSGSNGFTSNFKWYCQTHNVPPNNYSQFCGSGEITANLNLFYKLTRASEVEYKQANIVSLPADTVGAGTHEIVVEASDDLQTWTPVHSSSIGGNKAFFRTRVIKTGD